MSSFIRQSIFQIVRKITINEDKLKEIAKILGISDRDIQKGIAGKIYIGITPPDVIAASRRDRSRRPTSERDRLE